MKYKLIQTYPGYETLGITHCSENKTPDWRGTNFYDAHPKYWLKVEEVEEVDYEIISYVTDIANPQSKLQIYSVKRLSDGEVFTIGDRLIGFKDPIDKIKRKSSGSIWLNTNNRNHGWDITCAKKVKTPLFTTEDGVEIFEGDRFSIVQSSTFQRIDDCKYPLTHPDNWLCFSTRPKAKEYILLNKPCLSLNEISTVLNSTSPLFGKIIELAKSKL